MRTLFSESARIAGSNLWSRKLSSVLSSLGVLIGVMSVIAMVALIQGVNVSVMNLFQTLGANTFVVSKFGPGDNPYRDPELRMRKELDAADAEALVASCPSILAAAPQVYVAQKFKRGSKSTDPMAVVGTTAEYELISDAKLEKGRFFTEVEDRGKRQVVVLGADVADELFPEGREIGQYMLVGGRSFLVIGTMADRGDIFGQPLDTYVMIPYGTALKLFGREMHPDLYVKAKSAELFALAIDEAVSILRIRRGVPPDKENDFALVTQGSLMEMYSDMTSVIYIVLIGIASIALLVGGIGIMNMMLMSVTERTREIGVRKAIGARPRDIMWQFMVEAVAISLTGGVLGILLGIGIAEAVSRATPLPSSAPLWSIMVGFGVCVAVGTFFGIYPAARAASLNPIAALRHE
jgi:putative ABC transport system permease protein